MWWRRAPKQLKDGISRQRFRSNLQFAMIVKLEGANATYSETESTNCPIKTQLKGWWLYEPQLFVVVRVALKY